MWSPITVWMAGEGSDDLVTAGERAKAVVRVKGEDDGSVERIELSLVMSSFGAKQQSWPLGPVPTPLGLHELEVTLPADLTPSCAQFAEYAFNAELHRTKGMGSEAASVVDIIGRPEHVAWPDGPRAGTEGADVARVDLTLDAETVVAGGVVHGRVAVTAMHEVSRKDLEVALVLLRKQPGGDSEKVVARVVLGEKLSLATGDRIEHPFALELPPSVLPSLRASETIAVSWQVRAALGDAAGWQWVGVLDPEGNAGVRNAGSPSLAAFLLSLDPEPTR